MLGPGSWCSVLHAGLEVFWSWHRCILTILSHLCFFIMQLNGKQRHGSMGGKAGTPHPSWISCWDQYSWGLPAFIPRSVIYWVNAQGSCFCCHGAGTGRRQTGFGRDRRGQQCLPSHPAPGEGTAAPAKVRPGSSSAVCAPRARRLHRHRAVTRAACKANLAAGGFFSLFFVKCGGKKKRSCPSLHSPFQVNSF